MKSEDKVWLCRRYRNYPHSPSQTSSAESCGQRKTPIRNTHSPFYTTAIMLAGRVAARSLRVGAPRFQVAATRSFAEAAKPAADGRPPIELFGVDGTYASALVC